MNFHFLVHDIQHGLFHLETVNELLGLVIMIITFWTMFQFFDKLKKWSVLWRTVLGFSISWVIYLAIALTALISVLPIVNTK